MATALVALVCLLALPRSLALRAPLADWRAGRDGTARFASPRKDDGDLGYFKLPNDAEDAGLQMVAEANVFPMSAETKALLLSEMVVAFDNLRYDEVSDMLDSIVASRDAYTCARLLELLATMDRVYFELRRGDGSGLEELEDTARVTRSRIRMYANSHVAKSEQKDFKWPW